MLLTLRSKKFYQVFEKENFQLLGYLILINKYANYYLNSNICFFFLFTIFSINICIYHSGFESDAIPRDYLDQAPENLRTVRRNMVLLRRILKSFENGTDNFHVCYSTLSISYCFI